MRYQTALRSDALNAKVSGLLHGDGVQRNSGTNGKQVEVVGTEVPRKVPRKETEMNVTKNPTKDLIEEVGVYRLGGYDGCPCTHFQVRGISVDVSCRKSSGMDGPFPDFFGIGIRVYTRSDDADGAHLATVAKEVARQLQPEGYAIKVRYCTFEQDNEMKCTYCGKEREDINAYICEACSDKPRPWGKGTVADAYDHRKFEFYIPEPA